MSYPGPASPDPNQPDPNQPSNPNGTPDQAQFGQPPVGQNPYGHNSYGHNPYSQNPYSQNPYSGPPTGQIPASPYGSSGYDPTGYGAGGYGSAPYGSPGYAAPGYGMVDPLAPYGRDPMTGEPLSDKSKVAAGLLQIFLGSFGVGRFYIGDNTIGGIQLALTVIGFLSAFFIIGVFILFGVGVWALIDGIMILTGSVRDSNGLKLRS